MLIATLKTMREKGKRAYLRGDKLIVNGLIYIGEESKLADEKTKSSKRTVTERSPDVDRLEKDLRKGSKNLRR